jgi:cephalosporin hydroxylase
MDRSKKISRAMGLSQDNIFQKLFRIFSFILELIFVRLYNNFSRNSGDIPAQFHSLYYSSPERTWKNTRWMGHRTMKCPLDLWVYQEILYDLKPDIVIETGVNEGGGAAFLVSILDSIGKGKLITVDIELLECRPIHERITYIKGSSTEEKVVQQISDMIKDGQVVLVILDSDHNKPHVLKEMEVYSEFVTCGSYMIVEDSNVNGHPIIPNWGEGPYEAIEEFLTDNHSFKVDKECEKYYMTFNPNGYLKKIKE